MDKYTIENLELFYGDFKALKNINMKIQEKEITAFIGPSGCGKSTLLKTLNRMNDLVEGCRITGSVQLDGEDIYGKIDVNNLRKRVGHGIPEAKSVPDEHIRQHRLRSEDPRCSGKIEAE